MQMLFGLRRIIANVSFLTVSSDYYQRDGSKVIKEEGVE